MNNDSELTRLIDRRIDKKINDIFPTLVEKVSEAQGENIPLEKLINEKDVPDIFGIAQITWYTWKRKYHIEPYTRMGGTNYYTRKQLMELEASDFKSKRLGKARKAFE